MKKEIIETIRTTLYLKPGQVNETTLLEEIAKDSMDVIELVAVLSERYNVAIEPSKMNHIKTVADIVAYVMDNKDSKDRGLPIKSF